MFKAIASTIGLFLFLLSGSVEAATYAPSYVPGYGRLTYEDSYVRVYDNTGQYSAATARYRSHRRARSLRAADPWTRYKGRRHCGFRPDHHMPKCYVYDDCTYQDLYGDRYWDRRCPFSSRDDVRYTPKVEYRKTRLRTGPQHRSRPHKWNSRNKEEYQNSFDHYDSYGGSDGYREYNSYEWYD